METGFFHPSVGYWQTTGVVPKSILDAYPAGTVEVPLKPGADFDWIEGQWRPVQPAPPPVPQELSFAQLLIGLVTMGWITENEGDNWADGVLPGAVTQLIATLPQAERFAARARAKRPSTVLRGDALVNALAASQGKTQAELDDFFRTFSGV